MTAPNTADRASSWNAAMSASPGALDLLVDSASIQGTIPETLRGG